MRPKWRRTEGGTLEWRLKRKSGRKATFDFALLEDAVFVYSALVRRSLPIRAAAEIVNHLAFESAQAKISLDNLQRYSKRMGIRSCTDVSYEMARRYATGSGKPNWDRMNAIANFLAVDVNWLAYGEEAGEKPAEMSFIPLFKLGDKDIGPSVSGYDKMMVPMPADRKRPAKTG